MAPTVKSAASRACMITPSVVPRLKSRCSGRAEISVCRLPSSGEREKSAADAAGERRAFIDPERLALAHGPERRRWQASLGAEHDGHRADAAARVEAALPEQEPPRLDADGRVLHRRTAPRIADAHHLAGRVRQ